MTDIEPCLTGCDQALAEADRLIACLADFPASIEPELTATRQRIAAIRREVDRLRGMATVPTRRKIHPDWIDLASYGSPWTARGGDQVGPDQIGGVYSTNDSSHGAIGGAAHPAVAQKPRLMKAVLP